ncbi:hypothetical protein GCM10007088_12200 [Porphyromonas pasteri]|uniref:Uncharacterized protein n=1 Tax=Porphyromonas pasteri TaxID=1583331 RepID=A0ABQ2H8P5_9PORP|nr:hypothetical protein GCM10007088_12200 [Porphyromonas pasteri]
MSTAYEMVKILYTFEMPCNGLIYSAKASHAKLPDIPLRSDTQALRLIASIHLIQRRKKHRSREEKSTFT